MAKESSFDVVCRVDLSECDNAIQQAMREVAQRFDFKGTRCNVRREETAIVLAADDEYKLRALTELTEGKLVKRKVPLKALTYGNVEPAAGGTVRQRVTIQQGIPVEKAREIVKRVKASGLKVQAQIREDEVRVSGKSRDDLQAVMRALREEDLGIELQFTNYR
ncbi:MAG: YajQ family cyclic di-GMP-binding protein [candidate division NC10 bacterium]|nr:YajQ family cyclic di-GMP-binding protein [candidate division NC10 bacterium]MBI4391135.1 YajQ family cyclic di-GMP-binding protein [candidate division NC10 bacterium]